MPYARLSELPEAVRKLPLGGQKIFRAAFNAAMKQYEKEERAFATAWSAVKKQYQKVKGEWVLKQGGEEVTMADLFSDIRHVHSLFASHHPDPDKTPLAQAEAILKNVELSSRMEGVEIDYAKFLQNLEETFTPAFLPLDQYRDEYPGSFGSQMEHVKRAYNNLKKGDSYYQRGFICAFYADSIIVCKWNYDGYGEEQTYLRIPYTFNESDKSATFGEPEEVNVLTIVVPKDGGTSESDADQTADKRGEMEKMDPKTGEKREKVERRKMVTKRAAAGSTASRQEEGDDDDDDEAMAAAAVATEDDDEDQSTAGAVTRTENGQTFKPGAYLVIGDKSDPETWQVRVEETPGKVTLRQLGEAYASLVRKRKVELPEEQMQAAVERLQSLYRKLDMPYPGNEKNQSDFGGEANIPEWLILGDDPPGGDQELIQTFSFQVLVQNHDQKTGLMEVEGTATVANVINSKRQVYPVEVWQDNLPRLQRLAQSGKLLGECDHPPDGRSSLERTVIKFNEIWQDGNEFKFKGTVLPTEPHGKNIQIMLASGVPIDISSRGRGSVKRGEWNGVKGLDIVQRGFFCQTFDTVANGASPGSAINDYRYAQAATAEEDELMGDVSEGILAQLQQMSARQEELSKNNAATAALLEKLVGAGTRNEGGGGVAVADPPATGEGQNQNGGGTPAPEGGQPVNGGGQEMAYTKEMVQQMNNFLVGNRIEQLYEQSKTELPVQWANMYRKHLLKLSCGTLGELEQRAPGCLEAVKELIEDAPKYPGMGHIVQADKGERGPQTPRELIEALISDMPDESPDDPLKFLGASRMQQEGISDCIRTPRRQMRRWLHNIARAKVDGFNGEQAIRGLMMLEQGYRPQEVGDWMDQACPEGTTSVASGGAPTSNVFIFPLIRRLYPQLIASEIASVQPIDRPEGKIFFLDAYRIEPGASETDAAGVVSSSRVRIDRTDSLSSSYADDPGECEVSKRIQLHLAGRSVTAQTKKLHANWTIEELQDLRAYHGLDAAAELVTALARELALEWNQIILNELLAGATAGNVSFGTVAPSGYTQTEWDRYVARFFFQASNNIFKKRRGEMTHIIAGADAWLRLVGVFNLDTRNISTGEAFAGLSMTPFTDGPFAGLRTYKTSFWDAVNTNKVLVIRRGPEWSDTPYVWAPYIDYVSPVLTTPDIFTQKQGMMSRAAHSVVAGDAISVVTVNAGSTGVVI